VELKGAFKSENRGAERGKSSMIILPVDRRAKANKTFCLFCFYHIMTFYKYLSPF
jgi:hypothetical protein